jgi:hypothetical protein
MNRFWKRYDDRAQWLPCFLAVCHTNDSKFTFLPLWENPRWSPDSYYHGIYKDHPDAWPGGTDIVPFPRNFMIIHVGGEDAAQA